MTGFDTAEFAYILDTSVGPGIAWTNEMQQVVGILESGGVIQVQRLVGVP